jgi:hypothetical protein
MFFHQQLSDWPIDQNWNHHLSALDASIPFNILFWQEFALHNKEKKA